jgi:CMP-N,N'-diacetyllegionaminic acid synthase
VNTLYLIPARGGSKGLPGKNIKMLNGRPLLYYSIDMARKFTTEEWICVSTNDAEIRRKTEEYPLPVPFVRPEELSTDTAGTHEVMLHAIKWYEQNKDTLIERLVLLQPTSPLRLKEHVQEALDLYSGDCEMVVSVKRVKSDLLAACYKDVPGGYIGKAFESGGSTRRQDGETIYQVNGAVYVVNVAALKERAISKFTKVKKVVMEERYSVDIDEPLDWEWCRFLLTTQDLAGNK